LQFYNNTLQAIAAGYLIAALLYLVPNRRVRYALPLLMAVGYGVALAMGGDYTPTGNLAIRVEQWVFPSNRDGYSWTLTSLMFGAMTACGMYCTELLQSQKGCLRKVIILLILGGILLGCGLLLGIWEPAIKRIYTVSFTAQALGWGVLMLTALYFVIDVCHITRGWGLFTLYGQWALTAYLCGMIFWQPLTLTARILTQGLTHYLSSGVYDVVQTVVTVTFLTTILYLRQRLQRTKRLP
jgi:predicted acyltransferase